MDRPPIRRRWHSWRAHPEARCFRPIDRPRSSTRCAPPIRPAASPVRPIRCARHGGSSRSRCSCRSSGCCGVDPGWRDVKGASTIDTYLDYLRDVRRMSPNTLSSYARDLGALAAYAETKGRAPERLERRDLEAFARQLMTNGLAPRSVARAIACVRGYFKFLLVEKTVDADPAEDLRAPRAWPALPKYLALDEVDRLLAQPDTSTPRGVRDKALIELLYATGLRVTELLSLKAGDINLDAGYLTCIGKGDKQRIVPLGHSAADWVRRYAAEARPALLKGRKSNWLFVNAKGGTQLSRVGFWKVLKDY